MNLEVDLERLTLAHKTVRAELLAERAASGQWTGQLGSSPFATAAAVSALVAAHHRDSQHALRESATDGVQVAEQVVQGDLSELLLESVHWLARCQNSDGGWSDCIGGRSNIAATMLVQAAFRMTSIPAKYSDLMDRADDYVTAQGGLAGLRRQCGHDKPWLAAILVNCAMADMVSWRQVPTLQFELACLPKRWQRNLQLFAPRYMTPIVLAVGQAKFHHDPPKNPISRLLRRSMRAKSLAILQHLQAADDSFLASTPLTAFVVMSLSSIGCQEHPIVGRGIEFLLATVRADSSWAITPNLATSNTALALNSLVLQPQNDSSAHRDSVDDHNWHDTSFASDTLSDHSLTNGVAESKDHREYSAMDDNNSLCSESCLKWLFDAQRLAPDSLTEVPAGGWSMSDSAGSLPSTIATSGVLLFLARLHRHSPNRQLYRFELAAERGITWLLGLQNDDGGWASYYRDDTLMQFDPSGADVTAQVLQALAAWRQEWQSGAGSEKSHQTSGIGERINRAVESGWRYLQSQQQPDGSFIPPWFGNEHQPNEQNPVYATAQVLLAIGELKRFDSDVAQRAARWLAATQHANGGWGPPRAPVDYSGSEKDGGRRANEAMEKFCSIEETGLAVTALWPLADSNPALSRAVSRGLAWLIQAVEQDGHRHPAIVGYYLPKLWYYERLYPLAFAATALTRAIREIAVVTPTASHVG